MLKEEKIELRWILSVIRRWLWLIIFCTSLGTAAAFMVASRMPPVYSTYATLLVNVASSATSSDYNTIVASERLVLTYSQLLTERSVMETVIEQLELAETPGTLARRVKAAPIQDTQLIRLSVEDAYSVRVALIANCIAETFIERVEALRQAGEQGNVKVTIAETARVPEKPVSRHTLYVALAALVSGTLALGIAFLLEYLDNTIKTPDDVSEVLGLSTLGTICRLARGEKELAVVAQPLSPTAAAFHTLCTHIRFSSIDKPLHVLLVTSPGPGEGKSLTVANLAAAIAQTGLKVIAVDVDLRRPRLHQLFDVDLPAVDTEKSTPWGLTGSLMVGRADGRLRSTPADGLRFLPSGELPLNPIEMINSQRMLRLLHDLAQQADMVLVDSPPVLPVADAAALAPAVDGVLLVLEAGHTPREAARQAVENLRQGGANLVGVVLNGVSTPKGGYYHYQKEYYRERKKRRKRATK